MAPPLINQIQAQIGIHQVQFRDLFHQNTVILHILSEKQFWALLQQNTVILDLRSSKSGCRGLNSSNLRIGSLFRRPIDTIFI